VYDREIFSVELSLAFFKLVSIFTPAITDKRFYMPRHFQKKFLAINQLTFYNRMFPLHIINT